jgi:hypothetical protein
MFFSFFMKIEFYCSSQMLFLWYSWVANGFRFRIFFLSINNSCETVCIIGRKINVLSTTSQFYTVCWIDGTRAAQHLLEPYKNITLTNKSSLPTSSLFSLMEFKYLNLPMGPQDDLKGCLDSFKTNLVHSESSEVPNSTNKKLVENFFCANDILGRL